MRPHTATALRAVLVVVAVIHALPVAGVLGADILARLYGSAVYDPTVVVLLRHRAVLFGLLSAFLAYAAFRPELHRLALVAAYVSVVSFLALAWRSASGDAALLSVVRADWLALGLLVVGTVAHLRLRR